MVTSKNRPQATYTVSPYHAARDPIAELENVRNPSDARAFLDLSLAQIAALIPDTTSSIPHPINRSSFANWQSGIRTPRIEQIRIIENLIGDAITKEMAYDRMEDEPSRKYIVRIEVGKTQWFAKVFTTCTKCRRLYHITRRDSRRCKRCIARSKKR